MLTYNDLHAYQKRVIIQSISNECGYLFLDTGMGKTVITFAIHDQLKKRKLIKNSLVIAPLKVMQNVWRQEAANWTFAKDFTFSLIHGSTYSGSPEYSKRMAMMDLVDFHLINYEGVPWLSTYLLRYAISFPWDCVFYDESTFMKRTTTKRFKAFKQFMMRFKYRYCLTGTPIPNGLEDLFGQMYIIDKGQDVGCPNISAYRNKYLQPLYQLHGRVTVYGERCGAKQEVAKKIASKVSRLKKTEYLKLPDIIYHIKRISMPEDLMKLYKQLENEFFLEVGKDIIEVFSSTGASMKLRQFLQGQIYGIEGKPTRINEIKLNVLKDIELDGNCLIAYNFRFERKDLQSVTGNSPYLDGGTKEGDAEKWIIEWNNYEHKYFLVNPASAAFGLNLQAGGNNIIWYSLTWNAEHYSQLIDRLWRQGQRKEVNVYHIVFKNTIDDAIAKALTRKDQDQEALMNDIMKYKENKNDD